MMSSMSSCDWDEDVLNSYFLLCDKILEGQIYAVFYPYYLAPSYMKPMIKHSLLATRNVFGVGAVALYSLDGSLGVDSDTILALIPDLDFIILLVVFVTVVLTSFLTFCNDLNGRAIFIIPI